MLTRLDPLTRALREILDTVVTESARDALVDEALGLARLAELPNSAAGLLDFIEGPLLVTLERALGPELGQSVVEELERWIGPLSTRQRAPVAAPFVALTEPAPCVELTPSLGTIARDELGRSPTLPATRPHPLTDPNPPASGDYPHGMAQALGLASLAPQGGDANAPLPLVFVASLDANLVAKFTEWLEPRAVVVTMSRLVDMLLDIEDAGVRRVVIVVDGARPPVRLEAIAAVADELPDTTRVVLWGASRDGVARLCRISPTVARWLAVPSETPLADVAERCAALVG